MTSFRYRYTASIVALALLSGGLPTSIAAGQVPDLTKTIDFERKGEFHLGPTGAKGWIHTGGNYMTTDARQILITEVVPGSAADGKLKAGDVILGVGDRPFSSDARRSWGWPSTWPSERRTGES